MAEGFLNFKHGDRYEAFSAGVEASSVHPGAIEVMKEIGVDISMNRSKSIEEFHGIQFDYVATVCNTAREACPFLPQAERYLHRDFNDPARTEGEDEELLDSFRKVRGQINDWIEERFSSEEYPVE